MPVQVNIFLLLFGGLQGLLLSLFLIRKRSYRSGYVFLIVYIVVMLLQIILKVVSKVWLMENMHALYNLSYRLPYLYGPLVYLLTIYLLKKEKTFRATDLLHFVPFVMAVIVMFDYMANGKITFLTDLFFNSRNILGVQLTSIVIYHVLALLLWYRHDHSAKNYYSNIQKMQARWLQSFIWVSLFACTIIALAIYFMYIYYPHWSNARFLFVALTVFIYWISYTAMNQPQLFSIVNKNAVNNTSSLPVPKLVIHRPAKKYANSGLKEEYADRILDDLQKLVLAKKPQLNPELTIEDLGEMLSCTRHHLSEVLNKKLHRSFYDYINQLRIDEAKQLLLDPAKTNHKIASIAYDAGFNSLSVFNDVFKKATGTTPSQFRKEVHPLSKEQRG